MNYCYTLSFLSPLSGIEKITVVAIALLISILIIDKIKNEIKKRRNEKMLKDYLYIKQNKWNDLVELLTNTNTLTTSDIDTCLQTDLSKFDSKYKDIPYQELSRVKQHKNVNPENWKLLTSLLFIKKRNI